MGTTPQPGNAQPYFRPEPGDRAYKIKLVSPISDRNSRPSADGGCIQSQPDYGAQAQYA